MTERDSRPPGQVPRFLWLGKIASVAGICLCLLACVIVGLAFAPQRLEPLVMASRPVEDFESAQVKVEALRAIAPPDVRPECRALLLDHGKKTEHVYVLMHGLTNCPAQFRRLAEMLHQQGANVLVPRLPYHGYIEGLDYRQREMTAQAMLEAAGVAVDLAHGYGDKITIVGLSVNGTTAAWLAQNREDVDTAMIISPFFAPSGVSSRWVDPLSRLVSRLPNFLIWWDPVARAKIQGPEHAYARFATHPIAHVMRIGSDVFHRTRNGAPPRAGRVIFVTSAVDMAINNRLVDELAGLWKTSAPGHVTHHVFPASAKIPHDSIDPAQLGANTDYVYPRLLAWLNEG